jgi:hypothetical protein
MKKQSPLRGGVELQPRARNNDLVIRELSDEELVYDLKTHRAYCLNETAAAVWNHCDGHTTVTGIAQELSCDWKTPVNADLVWLALRQLSRSHLLECEIAYPHPTISRRLALRKISATALTVPLVMTIVAPTAVQAQSCGNPDNNANQNAVGCPCVGANDCASNCCGFSASPGNICVTPGTVPSGSPCRASCECPTGKSCPSSSPRICT